MATILIEGGVAATPSRGVHAAMVTLAKMADEAKVPDFGWATPLRAFARQSLRESRHTPVAVLQCRDIAT
jgi:hypothetical protein